MQLWHFCLKGYFLKERYHRGWKSLKKSHFYNFASEASNIYFQSDLNFGCQKDFFWENETFLGDFQTLCLGVKKSPIWVSRDGPKHEGGPLKNLKGKALTEVPTIVFDCAYVGSSVEAPSPRWWGAKWHQRWHMTSLKLEFNIYRGANHHPIWNWILESIAFSIILGWLERVGCPCRIKYRSFLNFLAPFWDHFGTIFRPDWDNFETVINQFETNLWPFMTIYDHLWPFMTIFWSIFETLGDLLDTSFGAKIQIFALMKV